MIPLFWSGIWPL